ncbi:hypothetical protein BGX31_002196 [Mortierella sp. GBA43]|nr:hypothetical protein BGX31_002196 [Mortierella sp. GBA43]
MESRVSITSAIEIYARRNEQTARITMEKTLPKLLQDCSHIIHGLEQEMTRLGLGNQPLDGKVKRRRTSKSKAPSMTTKPALEAKHHEDGNPDITEEMKLHELIQDDYIESQPSSSPTLCIDKSRLETDDGNTNSPHLAPPDGFVQPCSIERQETQVSDLNDLKNPPEPGVHHDIRPVILTCLGGSADTTGKKRKRVFEFTVEPLSDIPPSSVENVVLQQATPQGTDESTYNKPIAQAKSVTFAEVDEEIDADTESCISSSSHYSAVPSLCVHGDVSLLPHDSSSKTARIAYWNDLLSKKIYCLQECGIIAKLFLQSSGYRSSPATPNLSLFPRQSLQGNSPSPAKAMQHLSAPTRSEMIVELNVLLKGGNDILHSIDNYYGTRSDVLLIMNQKLSAIGQEQDSRSSWDHISNQNLIAELNRRLQFMDDRHMNRLWVSAHEIQASSAGLYHLLRTAM